MYCQRLIGTLAGLAIFGLALVPAAAPAQSFTKPVRIIVPFAPGGTSDILARLIGPKLQDAIGQPVVVENKTGAGGNIGADLVAKADKDGHTLLLIDITLNGAANTFMTRPLTGSGLSSASRISGVIRFAVADARRLASGLTSAAETALGVA